MKYVLLRDFIEAVYSADKVDVDCAWAVLKYREFGILRKARCLARIFGTDEFVLIESLPKDEHGRILDKPSRDLFNDLLVSRGQPDN